MAITQKSAPGTTLQQREELRRQERMSARFPATPSPAPAGKQTARSIAYKMAQEKPLPTLTKEQEAATQGVDPGFASDILRMITQIPPGPTRDKMISAFNQIQSLPAGEQKRWFDSLMTQAKQATDPQYKQDLTRLQEDFGFSKTGIETEKQFAKDNFNRFVQQTDFNRLREKAQDNKVLGDVLARITSDSFVTNVAGSGIIARRGQIARDEAARVEREKDITVGQNKGNEEAMLGQYVQRQDAQLGRQGQLQGRGETDLSQKNTYDTQSLFLDLFKNEAEETGQQVRADLTPTPSVTPQPTPQVLPDRITERSMPGTTLAERSKLRGQQRLAR